MDRSMADGHWISPYSIKIKSTPQLTHCYRSIEFRKSLCFIWVPINLTQDVTNLKGFSLTRKV